MKKLKKVGKKKNLLPVLLVAAAVIAVISLFIYYEPFFLSDTKVDAEYMESFDPRDNIKFLFLGNKDDVKISGFVDTDKLGKYDLTYSLFGKDQKVTVKVKDTTAPEIKTKKVEIDVPGEVKPEDFVESVSDAQDVKLAFEKGADLESTGKRTIKIIATDASGNKTEAKAELRRIEDTKGPEIASTIESAEILQGNELELDGIEVKDNMDPAPIWQVDTDQIDVTVPGEYTAVITATDRSGNSSKMEIPVTVKENPEYGKKVVYLTFDDGPSENTQKVLDILDKYGIKATFFVTGNGEAYNDKIKEAHDKGHTIGLHTYSHDYSYVYSSDDNYFHDLQTISDLVKEITGEESKVIRFPGGSSNTVSKNYNQGIMSRLTKEVEEQGYAYFDWNVSSGDAAGSNVAVNKILEQSKINAGQDVLVILFHDGPGKETTVEALPKVIEYYKNKGYVFAPLTTESFGAHHGVNN